MSLGHYGPRGASIFIAFVVGGLFASVTFREDPLVATAVAGVALAAISYQIGRVLEHDKMKQKKWYSEGEEAVDR